MIRFMYLSCDCQEEEEKKDEVLSMSMEFKVQEVISWRHVCINLGMLTKMKSSVHTFRKEMA